MTYTMDAIRVNAYNAMLHHLAEQRGSKLKGIFSEEIAPGEKHFFDRIGSFTASEISGLNTPVENQDGSFSRRMATLKNYDASTLVHDMEKMKMLVDPTSDIVIKLQNAHGKNFDNVVLAALLGSAATGRDGAGSAATFDSNNQIAHGSAVFTIAKLNQAIQKLMSADVDVDADELFLIINAKGMRGLMTDTAFTSADYQQIQPLAGRAYPKFRGLVNIVECERIPDETAGTTQRALLTTASALKVAKGRDLTVDISKRLDLKNQPWQVYTQQAFGAVRMEEALVIDILFQQA